MDKLPLDLQYLPNDKQRELDADIRKMLLEAVTKVERSIITERERVSEREREREEGVAHINYQHLYSLLCASPLSFLLFMFPVVSLFLVSCSCAPPNVAGNA